MITTRQIFDTVKTHLLTQNQQCGDMEGCKYRHDGKSCAVGCLITDEHYTHTIEGHPLNSISVLAVVEASLGRRRFVSACSFLSLV